MNILSTQLFAQKPNIVVFISDDAGIDMGCYGNKVIHTPTIDSLAATGIRFENAFLTAPQSSPSRSSILTGQYAHSIGAEDLGTYSDSVVAIPTYLRTLGYKTGAMLKGHWGACIENQFDIRIRGGYTKGGGGLRADSYKNFGDFVRSCGDSPFFAWIAFIDPHRNYNNDVCPQLNAPEDVIVPPNLVDNEFTRRDIADYYDEISRSDNDIALMINEIRTAGKLENTIIIYLSDNGAPFPHGKGTLYDAGIKTPLIFAGKGIEHGVHTNGLVSSIDLAPTILEICGYEKKPSQMKGESLLPILKDHTRRGKDYIFAERNWHDGLDYIRCIRTEKYKLIFNGFEQQYVMPGDVKRSPSNAELLKYLSKNELTELQKRPYIKREKFELYDIEEDINEIHNISDDNIEEFYRLRSLLDNWQQETRDITVKYAVKRDKKRFYKVKE